VSRPRAEPSLVVVVGAGGVGKTTLAAALALESARKGDDTLVMTFDPSMRLKDTLGVGDAARDREIEVEVDAKGRLFASLLDAKSTFDRLVGRYAPDSRSTARILKNRLYANLSGTLAGVLEYMAVERLFEVASDGQYDCVVLDTPPTRQAIDFLEAPARIIGFLDSGALRVALKPWFDEQGHLRGTSRFGVVGRGVEQFFDRIVGLGLLRDMAEFFQAFGPLYDGFRERATEVSALLTSPRTRFVLVTRPDEERIPETLFFARRLVESGHRLGSVIVNMRHPDEGGTARDGGGEGGRALMAWLGRHDTRGFVKLKARLPEHTVVDIPLLEHEPCDLESLEALCGLVAARLA